jgi:FMN phosphatase YigB (HAD superfamily)
LLVDDSEENVKVAESLGIQGMFFDINDPTSIDKLKRIVR